MSLIIMRRHIPKMLKPFYNKDCLEVGVDEAGRGPLFGRVYVGAAILPPSDDFNHSLMRDSKKLSERKRLVAYDYIKENAIAWTSYWMSEKEIDEINIFQATHRAMHAAIRKINIIPENILVDGNTFYPYMENGNIIPHVCIPRGDDQYTPIAAGSIIAKVERDKYIVEMCDKYPELDKLYGIRSNKGYGAQKTYRRD